MARKVVKRGSPTPPLFLFIELLVPWLVMGMVAILMLAAGFGAEVIFITSIVSAVIATVLMREYERVRRRHTRGRNG